MGQPGMGLGQPTPSRQSPAPKAPPGQETHAASTEESTQALQTQEPTLPQDPLAIDPKVKKRIGTSAD